MALFMVGMSVVITADADDDMSYFIRQLSEHLARDGVRAHLGGSPQSGRFTILVEVEAEDSFAAESQASTTLREAARAVLGTAQVDWPDTRQWPDGLRTEGLDVSLAQVAEG